MAWTSLDAKAWKEAWDGNPVLRKGLALIANEVRPKKGEVPLVQGVDFAPIFIKSAGNYEGAQSVLDLINDLGMIESTPEQDLSEPFSYVKTQEEKDAEEAATKK